MARGGGFRRAAPLALVALALAAAPAMAAKGCRVDTLAELPVTMEAMKALVSVGIEGRTVSLAVDSGDFYSMLTPDGAASLGLKTYPVFGLRVRGFGGEGEVSAAIAKSFSLSGQILHNVEFLVGGNEIAPETVGLLGQNVLRLADVEYDFAGGMVRLMQPHGCDKAMLAYWAQGKPMPISEVDIRPTTPLEPHTIGEVTVDGVKLATLFDSGSPRSMLSLAAARRLRIDMSKAQELGPGWGLGRREMRTWSVPVAGLTIGGEAVRNTRLLVGDFSGLNADLFLGADFFLSHRIYVANSQHKLYFTYNGGAVFNLGGTTLAQAGRNAAAQASTPVQASQPPTPDAAALVRIGAALAARRDWPAAVADLERATTLDPKDGEARYQLALARLGMGEPLAAVGDLDQAVALLPGDAQPRLARAGLRLAAHDQAGARADAEAIDGSLARADPLRLPLAAAKAIADYDAGLGERPKAAWSLWGRGLAELRTGDTAKAKVDLAAARKLAPTLPARAAKVGLAAP